MILLGTLVNTAAVLVGGTAGLLIKGGLKEKYREIMLQAVGISVVFIGLSGALGRLILEDSNPVLFIVSMVVGAVLGTWLDIEGKLQALGKRLERLIGGGEKSVSDGFVKASLLFCVGTMSILGALESGVQGNHTTLFAKSVLDGISSIIYAAAMGSGVLFSAASVLVYQGMMTLLARFIEPFLTADMQREIAIVGGILIAVLGLDMLGIKKMKAGNMLPAVLVPVVYYLLVPLFG